MEKIVLILSFTASFKRAQMGLIHAQKALPNQLLLIIIATLDTKALNDSEAGKTNNNNATLICCHCDFTKHLTFSIIKTNSCSVVVLSKEGKLIRSYAGI